MNEIESVLHLLPEEDVRLASVLKLLTLILIPLLSASIGLPPAAGAAIAPRPVIPDATSVGAPIGEPGGIMTPTVYCSNQRAEPRVKVVMSNPDTGWRRVYRWRGVFPGYGFPRAEVGQYRVRTVAACAGNWRSRTETVQVRQKTRARTVSRMEWHRVERGMTRPEVADAVGFDGRFGGRFGGETTRVYNMMKFWAWSVIVFRDGRVERKYWNVGHD